MPEYGVAVYICPTMAKLPKEMPAVVRENYDRFRRAHPEIGLTGNPELVIGPRFHFGYPVAWYEEVPDGQADSGETA